MWNYGDPYEDCGDVREYVAFYWNKVDSWFEEDTQVFVGPKDPYTRVDCVDSSRNVSISIKGVTVAQTQRPVLMTETGLPHRYYIPWVDVREDLLVLSERVVGSPYKGEANYLHVEIDGERVENVAWTYRYPPAEAARIAGYICFPQGKVDLYVDGELEPKPRSRWD